MKVITTAHHEYEFSESEQRALIKVHRLLEEISRIEGPNSPYWECMITIDELCEDISYQIWEEEDS